MNLYLFDDVGGKYERKNLYLKEIAKAYDKGDKDRVNELRRNKNSHPYIKKLKDYEKKKDDFEKSLKKEADDKFKDIKKKTLKNWKKELYKSQKRLEFYKDYLNLTYDADLFYNTSKVYIQRLPKMIKEYENNLRLLDEYENKKIDQKAQEEYQKEFEDFKIGIIENKKLSDQRLKDRFKNNDISKKAYENGLKENKINKDYAIRAKKYASPKKLNEDAIKKLKHNLTQGVKDEQKVLNEEISEVRRRTPIEVDKEKIKKAYFSIPIPGLGQLLNGQKEKAFINFIGALFIYLIAIPYALGFGNYQGEGVRGLISLAEGGLRVDRSLIFMIEGILAIVLLLLSVLIIVVSFTDAKKEEKNEIEGIRVRNLYETKSNLSENGFPYFVNLPALFLIVFIVLIPIITAILISFTDMNPKNQSKFHWAGLINYMTIFAAKGLQGKLFWKILVWTVIWTFGATTLQIIMGFLLAFFTNHDRIKGKKIFRTIFILPWAVPAFITIMFFSIMLAKNGFLANILSSIAGHSIDVKNSTIMTRVALILIQMWCGNAYIFLLATGVLQSIPNDLYEAAEMDGASAIQSLTKITLPLVFFQTAPIIVGQYTFNFNNYSIIDLFNGGGPFNTGEYGNLAGTSDLLISYIYKLTMDNQYQAFGAAITVLVSIALIVVAFLGYRNTQTFKE
ncbi:MAG: sugar ABC transporter permease [Tissierellia bacterium]|nr:sugar ABC transporter permease [Tissierellia bacterium]